MNNFFTPIVLPFYCLGIYSLYRTKCSFNCFKDDQIPITIHHFLFFLWIFFFIDC
eukprot:TRINITY_DN10077_c0_g1_i1.p1 TRINITY_DN10077_c0_g1~~TRINITY_DN10077_c0_g1_i1.p1  ORF type:complete len:55 (-),score=8.67 TRINITY_DN10077_c0_g1_i1:67-231(-)